MQDTEVEDEQIVQRRKFSNDISCKESYKGIEKSDPLRNEEQSKQTQAAGNGKQSEGIEEKFIHGGDLNAYFARKMAERKKAIAETVFRETKQQSALEIPDSPGQKTEEYRRMLGKFGVTGDLALQQVMIIY